MEAYEHNLPKDAPLRPLFLAGKAAGAKPDWTFNMLLKHGVRSCLEYAKNFDLKRARSLSNPDLALHLEFVDLGGHGYEKVRLSADAMRTEFVCIPRPITRSEKPDGGPIRYRVLHTAALWKKGEKPVLVQQVVEARAKLEKVAAADPRNVRDVSEVATTELMLKDFPAALQVIDQILTWRPGDFELLTERASFHFLWTADLSLLDQLTTGDTAKNASPTELATVRFWRAILHRDFHAAGDALATGNVQETDFDALGYFIPREWMEAMVAEGLGDHTTAQAKFLAARDRAATFSRERPNSGIALIVVAQLDAELGRKDDAIREGQQAVELFPIAKDAVIAPNVAYRLAAIYARLGERDRALELLEKLVPVPNALYFGELKLEPAWDPLRSDPRFQQLLAQLAPNDTK